MPTFPSVRLHPGRPLAVTLIVLLLISSAGAHIWSSRFKQPDPSLLYTALENSLQIKNVSCTIEDDFKERKSRQRITVDLTRPYTAATTTTISQKGTTVTTEGINTKQSEYIRYLNIETDKKDAAGKPLDFSEVVNVWGKQPVVDELSTLYGQTVLGGCVAPLANLSQSDARSFGRELRQGKIFQPNSSKHTVVRYQGRQLQQFEVTVQPAAYISFMKRLAKHQNMQDIEDISTETYADRTPEKIQFQIDASARVLRVLNYTNQKRTITFSDYNAIPEIQEPIRVIPTPQLEKRLQSVR